jgi:hypothetical protein
MATMYENLCGNCVGGVRVDNCMTFHRRAFNFFISLHVDLTILKIERHITGVFLKLPSK